jgi:hypothetical protein
MFDPGYLLRVPDHDDGALDRIGEPFEEPVVAFGSDGGTL